jgi:hypothetical protein
MQLESITSTMPPYQGLISAAPTPTISEFTVSGMTIEKIRHELPEFYRQQRYLSNPNALSILLEKAFLHLHHNYPIFHRPTMQLENFPTYLILAIASLGALLSDDQETQHFGLTLHNYVRDFIFSVYILLDPANCSLSCFLGIERFGFCRQCFCSTSREIILVNA